MHILRSAILAALVALGAVSMVPAEASAQRAATQPKPPAISAEVQSALQQMGQTLRAQDFSFTAKTIRVYTDPNGRPLHIFHTLKVLAHRPNHLLLDVSGDDGPTKLIYDGKTLVLFRPGDKHYASIPVPDTIRGMMEVALGRFGIDFPLADFLTDAPDQAFLAGVTSGTEVNTVTIDGVPCRHLFFMQPPGIELELWLEKSEQVLPRRLIVTYRSMQGQPSFVAEFSDWNFSVHPSDAEFAFRPPEGAVQVELKPPTAEKRKGGKS